MSFKQAVTIDTLIDLYNHEDIDDDFRIIASVGNKLIPLTLFEIDRDGKVLVLHDKYYSYVEKIDERCGTCSLLLDNGVCEYFNKEVNEHNSCSEWLFSKE